MILCVRGWRELCTWAQSSTTGRGRVCLPGQGWAGVHPRLCVIVFLKVLGGCVSPEHLIW